MGLEGIVSKRLDSPYRGGVSKAWVKVKCAQRDEFIIDGFIGSKGNVRSLLLGTPQGDRLHFVGKVGSGLTDSASRRLYDELSAVEQSQSPFVEDSAAARFTEPRLVAEVEYRGLSANGMLRHPVFKGVRDDKTVTDVAALPVPSRTSHLRSLPRWDRQPVFLPEACHPRPH
jgi:bifunctional non-homologous end joining protein LigD